MSIAVILAIFESRGQLSPSQRLVLLAHANFANEDGQNIYPSVRRIAGMTGLSQSQVRRVRAELVRAGFMEPVGMANPTGHAGRKTARFNICLEALNTPRADATPSASACDPSHGCASTPRTSAHLPLAPVRGNPSKEPSKEPSVDRLSSRREDPPAKRRAAWPLTPEMEEELAAIPYRNGGALAAFKDRHGLGFDVTGLRKIGVRLRRARKEESRT